MRLEEEIKQKKFKTEKEKAVLNIIYTGNWISSSQNKFFKKYNLTAQQYNVLRILRGMGTEPITVASIQERMLDKMSNASRLIDKLLAKGYCKRTVCEHDRRQVDILITEEGKKLLEEIDPEMVAINKAMNLSEKDAALLNSVLDKIRD
jgi:DNA-binding MarR family transcriptional regulator